MEFSVVVRFLLIKVADLAVEIVLCYRIVEHYTLILY